MTDEVPPAEADTPRRSRRRADEDASGATRSTPLRDGRRRTCPREPGPGAAERPPARERILFGETDDLLADVDSGVNENEFKW